MSLDPRNQQRIARIKKYNGEDNRRPHIFFDGSRWVVDCLNRTNGHWVHRALLFTGHLNRARGWNGSCRRNLEVDR